MKEYINKYYEIISYILFGVLTTVVNYAVYFSCTKVFNINYIVSNIIAWVIAVLFAFITNKMFVFKSNSFDYHTLVSELYKFMGARLFSGVLETILLFVFVNMLSFDDSIVKIILNILVIIINYVFSKFIVFSGGK